MQIAITFSVPLNTKAENVILLLTAVKWVPGGHQNCNKQHSHGLIRLPQTHCEVARAPHSSESGPSEASIPADGRGRLGRTEQVRSRTLEQKRASPYASHQIIPALQLASESQSKPNFVPPSVIGYRRNTQRVRKTQLLLDMTDLEFFFFCFQSHCDITRHVTATVVDRSMQ